MFGKIFTVLDLWLLIYPAWSSEPSCTRFEYEEKMLEKMVRSEFKVEQFANTLNDITKRVFEDIKTIKNEIETFKEQVQLKLDENDLESKVNLTDSLHQPVIIFRAHHVENTKPSTGQTIIFKTVDINEGSGYEQSTGVFTAPIRGLYTFNFNVCIYVNVHVYMAIVKEDEVVTTTVQNDETDYPTSNSGTAYMLMNKGEHAWIKCTQVEHSGKVQFREDNTCWNSFTGLLIRHV